jgi:hypothetical protein
MGAEVHVIDRKTFDHGGTRQKAVETLVDLPKPERGTWAITFALLLVTAFALKITAL